MKRKCILVFLGCLLLLCGCRQAKTDDTSNTTNTITNKTGPAKVTAFPNMDAYRETLRTVYSLEDLSEIFKNCQGWPETIQKNSMSMLLEQRFFLIPQVCNRAFDSVSFMAGGKSSFWTRLPDGCSLTVNVTHNKSSLENPQPELEREYFEIANGIPVLHCYGEKVKDNTNETTTRIDIYYIEYDGFLVEIFDANLCTCERKAIETLAFEKVEIQ